MFIFKCALFTLVFSLFGLVSYIDIGLSDLLTVSEVGNGYVKRDFLNDKLTLSYKKPRGWVKLSEVDEQAYMAIVISEDWSFFHHEGLDQLQIKQALAEYLVDSKRLRGASTISQQLIKNLFTNSERSLQRKIREMLLTLVLEQMTTKEKILETYLNNIQYGKNLYGISSASEFYFQKHPSQLNVKEGAFLAMLLPSPVRYAISYEQQSLTEFAQEKINNLLHKLKVAKVISSDELNFYSNDFTLFSREYSF